jgi:hypothetical protein
MCHLLALSEACHILHVSRIRVKKVEVTGDWRKYMLRSFMILFPHQTLR